MIEQVEKLEDILEPYHGQTVWCSSEDKCYRYDAIEGWQEVPEDWNTEVGMNMNIYDINKQIVSQLPTLSYEQIGKKLIEIRDFVKATDNKFYMLLCNDINYYTLFMRDLKIAKESIEEIVIECIQNLGDVKAIDDVDDAIEIWVENEHGCYAMYFFPYDRGVEVCK